MLGVSLALAVVLAAQVAGQSSIDVLASREDPYVNERVLIELRVKNFQECDAPVFPDVSGCTVSAFTTPSDSIYADRLAVRRTRTYQWEVTPRRSGDVRVEPIRVRVDGRELQTVPLTLHVGGDEGLLAASITCAESRLFVGQSAWFTLNLRVRAPLLGREPLSVDTVYAQMDGRRRGFPPFPPAERYDREVEHADGGDVTYYRFSIPAALTLERAGPVDLFESVEVRAQYPLRFGRDILDRLVVREQRPLSILPELHVPEVEPLPGRGRPAGFNGAVGQFELSASAAPSPVRVGDPIQLTIEIRGDGALRDLPAPPLASQTALNTDFRVPEELPTGTFDNGVRRFQQTIRAKRADVTRIPPIELAYFDPAKVEYAVARTAPIPIEVHPAPELDLAAFAGDAPGGAGYGAAPLEGLHGNDSDERSLLAVAPSVTLTGVAAALVAPPLTAGMAAALLCWRQRSRGAPRRRRPGAALRDARRLIESQRGEGPIVDAARIRRAMLEYLATRAAEPGAAPSAADAIDCLRQRGAPAELVERWRVLLERVEFAAFGGAAADSSLAQEALHCMDSTERVRL